MDKNIRRIREIGFLMSVERIIINIAEYQWIVAIYGLNKDLINELDVKYQIAVKNLIAEKKNQLYGTI